MFFALCKCVKNQNQDEKTAMDLLNIKNLENSIRNNERKNLERVKEIDTNNLLRDKLDISDEELEIIDYPYANKNINNKNQFDNEGKIKRNRNGPHLVNLPKTNINKNNKNLFNNNNKLNIDTNKRNSKGDITNSSINNDSLIIDDIDYLNDEDTNQITKKAKINIKKNIAPKKNINKIDIFKLKVINRKKKQDNSFYTLNNHINNSFRGSYKKNNDSIKTTNISTLNNSNRNNINKNKNKKVFCLSQKKEDKKFFKKINNNKKFNFGEKPKKNNNKGFSLLKNNLLNNTIKNNIKKILVNEQFPNYSIIKNENNINSTYNKKRINKRRINFKKVKLNLSESKNNKSYK